MMNDAKGSSGNGISRRLFLASTVAAVPWMPNAVTKAMAQTPRILIFSDHEPLGGMRTRFLMDVFFPAIEKESNGRLKIEAHWDGEIAQAYDALGAVSDGEVADITTAVPEYTAEELPLHQIFKSFPVGPSGQEQVAFFRKIYADVPEFSDEFVNNNVVPIFLATGFPVAFYSAERLASLDEIGGTTWRSASFWHLDFLTNSGAEAVRIPWGQEVYDAFAAHTLDGLMVNVDSGYNLKVYEQAPHILVSKKLWLGHLYPVVMNRDTWNGLAQENKDAIQRAAETAYAALGAEMDDSFVEQLEELEKLGATVRVLSDEEVSRFETMTKYKDVQAVWAEDQKTQGITDAATTIGKVTSIMAEIMG